jgi:hypothetical protein
MQILKFFMIHQNDKRIAEKNVIFGRAAIENESALPKDKSAE